MEVAVVYESMFGNTAMIAEAIAEGLRSSDPKGHVALLPVAEALPEKVGQVDLVVVGGPTHILGMSSARSRKGGIGVSEKPAKHGAEHRGLQPGAAGPGIREWLDSLPKAAQSTQAAAFDTRLSNPVAGRASTAIARRLRRHGYHMAAAPCSFVVEGTEGPVLDGERDRAKAWGGSLVQSSVGRSDIAVVNL